MNRFGEYVAHVRAKRMLLQRDIASQLGISVTYYSELERGTRPPKPLTMNGCLERLAQILEIDPDILYFYAGCLPPDIRTEDHTVREIIAAFTALREALKK